MAREPDEPALRARYDFPTAVEARFFYAIASTPRSGSTYLCHRLWARGVLGAPHEYFNYKAAMLQMAARVGAQDIDQYVRRLLALRTSPNGVFGFKAHRDQFELVVMADLLRFFPGLRFIRIDRDDRLAQAVSLALAEQTGHWSFWQRWARAPAYDATHIRGCLDRLDRAAEQWDALFARERIEPVCVRYEDLAEDAEATVDQILHRLDVPSPGAPRVSLPPCERLSGSLNREWIERYRREAAIG